MDQILELLKLYISEISNIITVIFIIIVLIIWKEHKKSSKSIDDKYNNLISSFKKNKENVKENGEILNIENESIAQIIENFRKSAEIGTENINTEVIIQKALGYDLLENEKKIKLLPSISIACGLLGTFIGLSLTILGTKEILDLGMSDYQNFASKMVAPLSSMGTAFISSICGVVCSIFLNKKNIQLEKLKEEFYDLIEDYLDNTIYALYAKNFTSQFEDFTKTVKDVMLKLTGEISTLFKDGVEELVGKINKNTIDLTDMVRAMNDSTKDLNRLSRSLNNSVENFKTPVEKFKVSMDDFINTSESTSKSIKDSVNKFGVNIVNLDDKLSEMKETLDINKTKMENIASSISDSSELMKKNYDNAENIMSGINKKQTDSMKDLKHTYEELSKSLKEFTEGFKVTQEVTAGNIANIIKNELSETKREITKDIDESMQDVKKSVSELNEKSDRVSKQTKESTDLFEKINNQLKDDKVQDDIVKRAISEKVSNELNDNIDQINKRLNDYVQYTQQKIDESINKLDDSIEKTKTNLDYSVNDLNESANYIKKETDKIADNVNKIIESNINDDKNN